MKIYRIFTALVILTMLIGLGGQPRQAVARPAQAEIGLDALYVPGEVVVGFVAGKTPQAYAAQASALAGQMNAQVAEIAGELALLQFDENADVPALVAQIHGMPGVVYAEPNYVRWIPEMEMDAGQVVKRPQQPRTAVTFRLKDTRGGSEQEITLSLSQLRLMRSIRRGQAVPTWPTDPDVWTQWGWSYTEAALVWPDRAVNPGVCVLDTGVDGKHPDLVGRVLAGYDFVNEDAKPDDDNGHGTHVAGTIAAIINNKRGFAGISTARVVPVKVLSAQGWGTAFDIFQGIIYCANRTDVRVINMSLGGFDPSYAEYIALDYAINGKGKLVVAAAGNSSTSKFFFPAAWAVEWVCKYGADNYPTPCSGANDNALAPGLISVGAARSPWSTSHDADEDGYLWVDTDGDGSEDGNEHFYVSECAADFSNYGAWVEMVAPGEDIFSTQPVSYDFYKGYFWGASSGYEWYSGTSMAAPHVAGGAARVWSAFPLETNANIANRLQVVFSWGKMDWAMDPNMDEPTAGYDDTGYQGEAPYCWPDNTKGGRYSMTGASYLNVAEAMNRTAFWQAVSDAITGMPLEKAQVSAHQMPANLLRDTAVVGRGNPWAVLLNLPYVGYPYGYTIRVNRAGYTAGAVDAYHGLQYSCYAGWPCSLMPLAIPPMGRITAVVNFLKLAPVDLYVWLPQSVPGGGAVVGYGDSGHGKDIGPGELSDFPRARWNYDGFMDSAGMESITIMPRVGSLTVPWYLSTYSDYYDFFITDYGWGGLNYDPIFRLWIGGKIVAFVPKSDVCGLGEAWWWAGWIQLYPGNPSAIRFVGVDECGGSVLWPYASGSSGVVRGIPERPTTRR